MGAVSAPQEHAPLPLSSTERFYDDGTALSPDAPAVGYGSPPPNSLPTIVLPSWDFGCCCTSQLPQEHRAAGSAPTPSGATVPRERSYKQLVARRDNKITGDFVLISPMSVSRLSRLDKDGSRDSRLFLRPAMAWEWRWGLSRTVGNGDTAHTANTVRLPDVLRCRFFPCDSRNYVLRSISFFADEEKKSTKREINAAIFEFSVKREKKCS